mmetsp:Transcript_4054/g.9745  ORF Transcript_4054/g.9745 Transcript_4054/m.9745 type:complete len:431 (-) Transcript_4054:94-1386(-)
MNTTSPSAWRRIMLPGFRSLWHATTRSGAHAAPPPSPHSDRHPRCGHRDYDVDNYHSATCAPPHMLGNPYVTGGYRVRLTWWQCVVSAFRPNHYEFLNIWTHAAALMWYASALVHVYTDGTVLVSHGGVEMGQGLHTKVAQVVAAELDVPLALVHVHDTHTAKVARSSATAASMGSDLYAEAARRASAQIAARMAPYRGAAGGTWAAAARAAWCDRVDLSAHAFYKVPHISGFDFATGRGTPFSYFTCGAACSLVEADVLTGDHRVLRTDIVMDVGRSLNPHVDIGQIEGAFVQGQGWLTVEDVVYGSREHVWLAPGQQHMPGPGTYKLPAADDAPRHFNVHLLRNSRNSRAVHSSRAVGEPPLLLSASVLFALRHAVGAARADNNVDRWFAVDTPMSAERVRMACCDPVVRYVVGDDERASTWRAAGAY